jgi:hypothetical protein
MPASAKLFVIEMNCINSLSRPQLLEAIRERGDALPSDLQYRTDEESLDRLRLVLCTARLIHALRQIPRDLSLEALLEA